MKLEKQISKLTLKFHDLKIEEKYQNHIKNVRMKYLVLLLLIIQLINFFFLNNYFKDYHVNKSFPNLKLYTSIVIILPCLSIILLIIKFIFPKLELLFDLSIYFIYSVVTENMTVILLYSMKILDWETYFIHLIHIIYILFTLFYVVLIKCEFLTITISNLILIFLSFWTINNFEIRLVIILSKFIFPYLIYALEKFFKMNFLEKLKLKKKFKFLNSIIKYMPCGLFVNNGANIRFHNNYSLEHLQFLINPKDESYSDKSNVTQEILISKNKIKNEDPHDINNNTNQITIKDDIFKDIIIISELPDKFIETLNNHKSYSEICSYLYDEEYFKTEFKYIGRKIYKFNEQQIELEIFIKVSQKKKYIEFIIIDNTKIKQIIESRTIAIFQDILSSKVSNNFKKPLISIMSLLKEINNDKIIKKLNKKKIQMIFDLSIFMFLRLNDFELVGKLNNNEINLNLSNLDLKEKMNQLSNIVKSLLITLSKSKEIQFNLEISEDIPKKIRLDQLRLFQILLNLISNSIKFTNSGSITLRISSEYLDSKKIIKFSVIDTGIGISSMDKINLYTNFFDKLLEIDKNSGFSSQIGLSLVNFLCIKMGTRIEQSDNKPMGTCFSFAFEYSKIYESEINTKSPKKTSEIKLIKSILPRKVTIINQNKSFLNRQSTFNLIKENNKVSKILSESSLEGNETVVLDINNTNKPIISHTSRLSTFKKISIFRNNTYIPNNRLSISKEEEINNDMKLNTFDYSFLEIDSEPDLMIKSQENRSDKINLDFNFMINNINEKTDIFLKINKYLKY